MCMLISKLILWATLLLLKVLKNIKQFTRNDFEKNYTDFVK